MPGSFHYYYCFKSKRQNISKNQSDEFFPFKCSKLSQIQGVKLKQTSWTIEQGTKALSHVELKETRRMFSCHPKTQKPLCSHPDLERAALPWRMLQAWWGEHISAVLSFCLVEKVTASVTWPLLEHSPVSQRNIAGVSPAQAQVMSCSCLSGAAEALLAPVPQAGTDQSHPGAREVSLLSLFQRLDCGLCYRSPTLHLLETPSPDTPTWFLCSSVYSSPSASQMFQLHQILLLQFSLKYAPLPFCSSSDEL